MCLVMDIVKYYSSKQTWSMFLKKELKYAESKGDNDWNLDVSNASYGGLFL